MMISGLPLKLIQQTTPSLHHQPSEAWTDQYLSAPNDGFVLLHVLLYGLAPVYISVRGLCYTSRSIWIERGLPTVGEPCESMAPWSGLVAFEVAGVKRSSCVWEYYAL